VPKYRPTPVLKKQNLLQKTASKLLSKKDKKIYAINEENDDYN
jgi:hypothetical protein